MGRRKKLWLGIAAFALLLLLVWWLGRSNSHEIARVDPLPAAVIDVQPNAAQPRPEPSRAIANSSRLPILKAGDAPIDAGVGSANSAALFGGLVQMSSGLSLAELLAKNAKSADAHLDKLCANEKKLRAELPLADPDPGSAGQDAAFFMAPLMDYEKPLDQPPGRLHIDQPMRDRISAYGQEWPSRITDQDLAGLDFSWLPALAQFDHWSMLTAGRLRDVPWTNFFTTPIPNYLSLIYWSKLRYAQALRTGDTAAASTQVTHLADLLRTQGILLADGVAVVLYKLDYAAQVYAGSTGADVSSWTPADPSLLQLYRTTDFASMYFTYPGVSAETLRKAIDCMPDPCVALVEGLGAHHSFGNYAATDNSALIQELAVAKHCDTAMISRIAGSVEQAPGDSLGQFDGELDTQIDKQLGPP